MLELLYINPQRLFPSGMPEEVGTAKRALETARARYEKDCLRVPDPKSTASTDSEFVAMDLPATIGGEVFLSEPPLKMALAGYVALGLGVVVVTLGYAAVAGYTAASGGVSAVTIVTEGATAGSAWEAVFLGLRLVTP